MTEYLSTAIRLMHGTLSRQHKLTLDEYEGKRLLHEIEALAKTAERSAAKAVMFEELATSSVYAGQWIPVVRDLPKQEEPVEVAVSLVSALTGKLHSFVTVAIYEDGSMPQVDSQFNFEADQCDYNEEDDEYYIPAGWYEYHSYGDLECNGIASISDHFTKDHVTHWRPLPQAPKEETFNDQA